jgi:amino acid transporter
MEDRRSIGYWSVAAIGVGGMVGGGIFAVLGLAVQLAHGGTPLAFFLAGMVALVTARSYVHLSLSYPSKGGTVEYINRAFGPGIFSGGLNILLFLSYIVMLSLYAYAFGTYGGSLFPEAMQPIMKHALISAVVLLLTGLNMKGAALVGEAEEWIVALKVLILLIFIAAGLWTVETTRLLPVAWSPAGRLMAGGMIIFLAYEGFELIANTAEDVKNPTKTLPLAYYSAVGFVICLYVVISAVTVGNLSLKAVIAARDYALAESARPFLGNFGFILIAIAAMLSTGSAINATLYGAARISYITAKEGELPTWLERKVWNRPVEGLLITAGITLLVANLLDLSSISMMGSAGFLIIFAVVNAADYWVGRSPGGRWISLLGVVACLGALGAVVWQTVTGNPGKIWVLIAMIGMAFVAEIVYRSVTGRKMGKPVPS